MAVIGLIVAIAVAVWVSPLVAIAVLIVAIELTKLKVKRKLAHEQERVWEEANYVYGAFLRLAFYRLKARGGTVVLVDACAVFGWGMGKGQSL